MRPLTMAERELLAPARIARGRAAVLSCLDHLLDQGRDHYGPISTPMFMSVIDVHTGEAPREPAVLDGLIRTEERLHRRNPGGCDLWDDQPLLRTLYAASQQTGDPRYATAADDYIRAFYAHARRPNGLLGWGTHLYYDAYTDAVIDGPHEMLSLCPQWAALWRVNPTVTRAEIEGIWEWHLVDRQTGEHNRHDDRGHGCAFDFSGAEFMYAFAFLYCQTHDPQHLAWAKAISDYHWRARNPQTNLTPDCPSTAPRYDAFHASTAQPGPLTALHLKAWEVSGDAEFRGRALAYLGAYHRYGWDAGAQQHWGMLALDGTPIPEQARGADYDVYRPTGYVEVWLTDPYGYEMPLAAAQTAIYAAERTGDATALASARAWAANIRTLLPPHLGRRWRQEMLAALPDLERRGGTYAENYGRAISFFLRLHAVTGESAALADAVALADEAVEKLFVNGWFVGHPAKPYYEAIDGVAYLMYALLELAQYPDLLDVNL